MSRNAACRVRRFVLPLIFVCLAVAGCRSGAAVARSTSHFPPGTGFVQRRVPIDGVLQNLWVFVPRDYDEAASYPAIVFLHGLFEAGFGGTNALSAGLGPVIAQSPDDWPFIVLFPQSSGTWRGESRQRLAMQTLDWAQREYAIDRRRVILAGLSYGGLGTWQIGARHPERFAALVPVSAFRDLECADELIATPVWAFHNRGDPIVDADGSEEMCRQIMQLGGQAQYTSFDRIAHDCWDRAVEETDLVQWMLRQRRPSIAVAAAE